MIACCPQHVHKGSAPRPLKEKKEVLVTLNLLALVKVVSVLLVSLLLSLLPPLPPLLPLPLLLLPPLNPLILLALLPPRLLLVTPLLLVSFCSLRFPLVIVICINDNEIGASPVEDSGVKTSVGLLSLLALLWYSIIIIIKSDANFFFSGSHYLLNSANLFYYCKCMNIFVCLLN